MGRRRTNEHLGDAVTVVRKVGVRSVVGLVHRGLRLPPWVVLKIHARIRRLVYGARRTWSVSPSRGANPDAFPGSHRASGSCCRAAGHRLPART